GERAATREVGDVAEEAVFVPLGDERLRVVLPDGRDVFEADADGRRTTLDHALGLADVDVGRQDVDSAPLRVADEGRRRIEAHRLLVQERAQELRRVVVPEPLRLVREQAEGRRVRLREAEAGEADELVEDAVGNVRVDAVRGRARDEALAERLERVVAPFAAHRAPQPFGLADGEACEGHRHLEHLVLEDDDSEGGAERLAQELVVDRPDVGGVVAELLARVDVRVHGLALDRPGPDERDLDGEVVQVRRQRAPEALHLRAALDLERAHGVGALDLGEDVGIVEGDAREVDDLVPRARDLVDTVLDRREHPEPEQVDLQEAGIRARVLVPLAELPAGHRRRLYRDDLDERARRDDHPARVLRDVTRETGDLPGQPRERAPAPREELPLPVRQLRELVSHAPRVPTVRHAREALELGGREAERLADVTDRAARTVRGEARDEGGVLAPVALGDGDDELLADVAREVE